MKIFPISTAFKHSLAKLALAILRGLRSCVQALGYLAKPLAVVGAMLWNGLLPVIILPVYRVVLVVRIRLSRMLRSARGFFFLLFTNRYLFHAAVVCIAVAAIVSQLQPKGAHAFETGQHSLLYALVTDDREEVVEEPVRPELLAKDTNYLGAATIQAVPSVDFDYENTNDTNAPLADLGVPGSIASEPGNANTGTGTPPKPAVQVARTKTETYVVEPGDTVGSIAEQFGVNVGTIIWNNNLQSDGSIKPGDMLRIPPISGMLHTVQKGDTVEKLANLYSANPDEIASANHLTPNAALALGQELIVPGGSPPPAPAPAPASKPSKPAAPSHSAVALRPDVPKTTISNKTYDKYQELATNGQDTRVKPADLTNVATSPGKLLWPTVQHLINQYYGWQHTGVDINGDYTDPIYAADDGVVESAGWNNGGYGLMIMIDSPDGYRTRYGHASKLFVNAGDQVKRGQVIGMIGTTGRSTGTHLHFEVYVNGVRTNPLGYIK